MTFAVVGAGMVGCATALALRKRGHDVTVYERRPDPRLASSKEVGRSINLAISARGLRALEAIDPELSVEIRRSIVPMRGRMLHSKDEAMQPVLYGLTGTESINSIGRAHLNNSMIDAVERAGIEIKFDSAAPSTLEGLGHLASTVFGCDGTYSKVRDVIAKNEDTKLEIETVGTYYMEVPVQHAAQWERNYLHLWPRGSHMFIALPNADGSFTGTLFAPRSVFETHIADKDSFIAWFSSEFPDAAKVVGEPLLAELARCAPRGKLTSLKFSPYNLGSSAIVLGDAAHSMVPFYGQGLNAGLEDVRVLFEEFIDAKYPDPAQWKQAFDAYSAHRKPDCDAINTLSMNNYLEMSSSVATTGFRLRKRLDNLLARVLGDRWLPLYTMVSFRDDVRYSEALEMSARQQQFIDSVVQSFTSLGSIAILGLAVAAFKKYSRRP